jgi:hypothetical protein
MEAKDHEDFERLGNALEEAHRRWRILRRLLATANTSKIPTKWLDESWHALTYIVDQFKACEKVIDKQPLPKKASAKPPASKAKTKTKAKSSRAGDSARTKTARPDLSFDTKTVPGAVRTVLIGHPDDGLLLGELFKAAKEINPKVTYGLLTGAVHHMIKRGEIARTGFHKHYRYKLIVRPQSAETARASEETDIADESALGEEDEVVEEIPEDDDTSPEEGGAPV